MYIYCVYSQLSALQFHSTVTAHAHTYHMQPCVPLLPDLPGPSIPGGDSGREAAKVKDVKICSSGDHKFTDSLVDHPCRICTVCGHCTGYGPTCISTKGIGERIPGK